MTHCESTTTQDTVVTSTTFTIQDCSGALQISAGTSTLAIANTGEVLSLGVIVLLLTFSFFLTLFSDLKKYG